MKRRGRPPTRTIADPLPPPRRFSLKANEFFQYWKDTEALDPNRLIVYVWRTFPIIDRKMGDDLAPTNIGKMEEAPADPTEWRQEMLHRFGSGNYKLMLKDEGIGKAIAQTFVTDLNDPEYPPWIENLEELVMDHPSNQSYIENLRQKGLLPGEREMASSEAMSIMAGTVKDLASQVATTKQKEPAPASPQIPPTPVEVATRTIDMANNAFQQGLSMAERVTDARVKAAEEVASAKAEQNNPSSGFKMLEQVIGLVKELQPPAAAVTTQQANPAENALAEVFMKRITDLQSEVLKMNNERVASLERQITQMQSAPPAAVAPATSGGGKDDMISSLERLAKLKDTFQDLFGGGRAAEEVAEKEAPLWMRLLETAMGSLPTIATAVASALMLSSYNNAVARTGQGIPQLPPAPDPAPPEERGGLGLVPTPGSDTQLPPTAGDQPNVSVYVAMLRQLERPLLNHLNDPSKTGADFAAALMDFHGRIAYDAICAMGQDALMALLNSYPPIANVLQQIPDQAAQFISDFVNADAILNGEEAVDDSGEENTGVVGSATTDNLPPIVRVQAADTIPAPPVTVMKKKPAK
jgi:hypothetical protein